MKETRVLIAGGYGAVGKEIVKLLAPKSGIMPVVGGRNDKKAESLANQLNCEWIRIDLDNGESISKALKDIDIVINCYLPSNNYPVRLAKSAIEQQTHYLDVSAFNGFCRRVIRLNPLASEKGVTLITALGAYPGIPGLILADAREHFSEIHSAEFYFVMGGKLEGLTPLSLMGVHYMMDAPALVWDTNQWQKPQATGAQEAISEPFNKNIFFS
ncbi:MAG: NAD(P)H-binding protein, partial [Desulfobacteraceae bacterium]|nr:NAD(P)H-binding protein [Desulfobacteraceae bacterium]